MRSLKKYLVGLSSAALVLGSVATLVAPASAASSASPPFSDISGSADQGAITFLASIGAVNGVGNGLYDPTGPVTRAAFAKMVVNMLGLGNVATALANETPSFKDASKIPTWAWGYVNVAADDGLIVGYPNHTFGGNNTLTDAEAATVIIRALNDTSQVLAPSNSKAWPGNFVTAAYTLGLTSGVNFVANLPATRGDVAELLYNAAMSAPMYVASNTTPVTYTKYPPLYEGGVTGNNVGGFLAYEGTVTNVNATSVSLSYTGTGPDTTDFNPACPTAPTVAPGATVTGTTYSSYTCAPSFNWASSYQLVGATTTASLLNGTVTLLYNTNNSNVVYAALTSGASANTGTLSSGNNIPSGYYAMSEGDTPWLVTNSYVCSQQSAITNDTQATFLSSVDGTTCDYFLLLHGTPDQALQLASVVEGQGTEYEINPSSDGTDPGTQSNVTTNGVPSYIQFNPTYLTAGDTVSYTLNSNKEITVLNETNVNDQIGRVVSTYCVSGCDNTISAGATPQIEISVNGTDYWLNVQPYTTLTVNGQTATLSSSLDNTAAYVAVAGGYGTNTSGAPNVGGFNASGVSATTDLLGAGDGNAVSIALYQNEVSGTVTSISTSSSAPNAGTSSNPNDISAFTLQPSSGSPVTYTTDANFSGVVPVGQTVTVALDSSGEARAIVSSVTSTTYLASMVTSWGQSTSTVSATTYQVNVQDTNGAQTFSLTPSQYAADFNGANPSVFSSSDMTNGSNNGAYLVTQNTSGSLTVQPMLYVNSQFAPSGDNVAVVSESSGSVVLGIYKPGGDTLDYSANGGNPYITVVLGDGFNDSGDTVGFTGLTTGHIVSVYSFGTPEGPYYDVVDTGNALP